MGTLSGDSSETTGKEGGRDGGRERGRKGGREGGRGGERERGKESKEYEQNSQCETLSVLLNGILLGKDVLMHL